MTTLAPKRNLLMDNAKGILILLVVFGHCIEQICNQGILLQIHNVIYLFHMPLFIFITGYFTNTDKDKGKYFDSVLDLFCTFALFQVIRLVFSRSFSFYSILTPQWTLWYLLSVVFWKIGIYLFRNLSHKYLIALSACLALFGAFLPYDYILSFQRTLTFSIFFVLGYVAKQRHFDFSSFRNKWLLLLSFTICISAFFLLKEDVNWLLYGANTYYSYDCSLILAPFAKFGILLIGLVLSACLLGYCTENQYLGRIGELSLFIYLYHTFAINVLKVILSKLGMLNPIGCLMSFVLVLIGLMIAIKIPYLHRILRPYKMIKGMRK